MTIQLAADLEIARSVHDVFATLDDFTNTPQWNDRCVEIHQVSQGPRGVGATLHYTYQEPGRRGTMDGVVVEYVPDARLVMRFSDKMLDVVVGFALHATGASTTHVHHTIDITPKTLLMKLMAPLIRRATTQQVQKEVAGLARLLPAL
jgi:uncharacterized protein YndB with AHSA1/START domain